MIGNPFRRAVVLAAATVLTVACGDDDGASGEAFCDEMAEVQGDLGSLSTSDPASLDSVVERLRQVEPPAEIAEAYQGVVDGYAAMAEDGGLTDPAAQDRLVEAQEHLTQLSEYLAENCDVPAPAGGG
ncbi:MAG TPA: hypothetical protein VFH36_01355 [Acidimicrobiales bacterium]|nr:hypothetical protein [Acidimicrobiales bacterium]